MSSTTDDPTVVRVSQKGQATISKSLRETFGIETPGELFVYEDEGRIVVEPIPSIDELGGIHATGDRDNGAIFERVHGLREDEK